MAYSSVSMRTQTFAQNARTSRLLRRLRTAGSLPSWKSEGSRVRYLPGFVGKLRWGTQEFSGKNLSEFAARQEDARDYSTEKPQPSMCVWRLPRKNRATLEIKKSSHTSHTSKPT